MAFSFDPGLAISSGLFGAILGEPEYIDRDVQEEHGFVFPYSSESPSDLFSSSPGFVVSRR